MLLQHETNVCWTDTKLSFCCFPLLSEWKIKTSVSVWHREVARKVKRAWHLTYPSTAFEKLRRAVGKHNICQNWASNVDSFLFADTFWLWMGHACHLKPGMWTYHLFPPPLHYIMSLRSSCNWWKLHKSHDICFSQVAICQNWASNVDSFQFLDHIVTLKLPSLTI